MRKARLKIGVGLVGLFITIFGWYVSIAKHPSLIHDILCPDYSRVKNASEILQQKDKTLSLADEGFSEITQIILENTNKQFDSKIEKLVHLNSKFSVGRTNNGLESKKVLQLQMLFNGREPAIANVYDLDLLVQAKYSRNIISKWSTYIFWTGIAISLFSLFFVK